ncbi:hypothetical protein AB1Y20_020190 [Prymnesium parvum]|uniref:Uncharacterized protein n=1 Tax=Prymnesium parvum TaxID=97485 RepID=A0AB34JU01_PRYPA|mmetsp:Transcript_7310/g.12705  ORF Transcript_7310/g.12705 Transcript_7310/m.12705 type:complete len:308 (-) Transcript_7310:51-974(-)
MEEAARMLQSAWRRHMQASLSRLRNERYDGMVSLLRSAGMVRPGPQRSSCVRNPCSHAVGVLQDRDRLSSMKSGEITTAENIIEVLYQLRDRLRSLDDQTPVRAATMRTLTGVLVTNIHQLQFEVEAQQQEVYALAWETHKARTALGVSPKDDIAKAITELRRELGAVRAELDVAHGERRRLEHELQTARDAHSQADLRTQELHVALASKEGELQQSRAEIRRSVTSEARASIDVENGAPQALAHSRSMDSFRHRHGSTTFPGATRAAHKSTSRKVPDSLQTNQLSRGCMNSTARQAESMFGHTVNS